jgi:hypothetical protein
MAEALTLSLLPDRGDVESIHALETEQDMGEEI